MSDREVVASRVMQFCAGPEKHTFYACAEHAPDLERGDISCFLRLTNEPVRPVNNPDEDSCYFCREG